VKLKRKDFQELARLRLKEARALVRAGCWEGGYYLAGYAVECAFKACIARGTERYEFPEIERVRSSYTHDLEKLLRVAKLHDPLVEAMRREPRLAFNWAHVGEWSENARYERRSEADATTLLMAIRDRKYGVLSWLKKRW
jgi:HEPN domain-containing protein